MTLEEARNAFYLERGRAIEDLRKPFVEAVARAERALRVPVIKRPKGLFRRFLMRDFERVRQDYQIRATAAESARSRLREFDAGAKERQNPLQHDIDMRTWRRCDAVDPAIREAIRREQARMDAAKRLAEAVSDFNQASGEKHELMTPQTLKGKWGGTPVDAIELADQLFVRATNDKGYSYALFPWQSGMEANINRPCWYWYDGKGRMRFEPQIGTRTPLPRATS